MKTDKLPPLQRHKDAPSPGPPPSLAAGSMVRPSSVSPCDSSAALPPLIRPTDPTRSSPSTQGACCRVSRPNVAACPLLLCSRVAALLIGRWGPDRVGWNDRGRLCWATPGSLPVVAILTLWLPCVPSDKHCHGRDWSFPNIPSSRLVEGNFFSLLSPLTSHLCRVSELTASGHMVCMHSSCQPRRHHGPRTRASSQSPTIPPGRFCNRQKRPVSQTRPRAETIPSWLQIRLAINRLKPAGSHGPPPRRTRRSEASPAARHELFPQPRGLAFLSLPFHTPSW